MPRAALLVAADGDPDRHWRRGSLALVNSVGNLGGLAGPSIVGMIRQATGNEPKSGQATRAGVGLRSASSFAAGLPFVSSAAPVAPGFSSPFAAAREMST